MLDVIRNFLASVEATVPPGHQIVPDGCRIVMPTRGPGGYQMIVDFHIEPRGDDVVPSVDA